MNAINPNHIQTASTDLFLCLLVFNYLFFVCLKVHFSTRFIFVMNSWPIVKTLNFACLMQNHISFIRSIFTSLQVAFFDHVCGFKLQLADYGFI
jgi:hypothetical protein